MQYRKILRCMLFYIFCIASLYSGYSQFDQPLEFPDIRLEISERQFRDLKGVRGQKLELNKARMTIDGNPAKIRDLHVRGKTTLHFSRKSFSVDLEESVPIISGNTQKSLKDFDLLSLVMDKNLWHNRWAYEVMSHLGIFPMLITYCTVHINNEAQGIYLMVEKPQHAVTAIQSPYMIRRGPEATIDKEYSRNCSKEDAKSYKKQYRSMYNSGGLKGEALYGHISKALNIRNYFYWIGFNYLVMNGDYSDELYLYINPASGLFEPIAWDYDDLFMKAPHEGIETRNTKYADKFLFSMEDELDRYIAGDDLLYTRYLESCYEMLLKLDDGLLEDTANKVRYELQILCANAENARASRYMDKHPLDMDQASRDMEQSIEFVKLRKELFLKGIARYNK